MEDILSQMQARLDHIEMLVTALEAGMREWGGRVADKTLVVGLMFGLGAWLTLLVGLQTWFLRR
jgi:hypothetical protein